MTVIKPMKLFMEPESVALIGVKRKTAEGTLSTIENILKLGFSGRIYPINPNAERVLGLRAYPNVKDVEGEIDLAVISTPRETVLGIVEECIEK
ncbi:MAG: CoA-binding protein, partial [Thermodesulfobacteriota bacterium]|nr:CoA-binding protein [Thermodesulfobacteriota bacterium]